MYISICIYIYISIYMCVCACVIIRRYMHWKKKICEMVTVHRFSLKTSRGEVPAETIDDVACRSVKSKTLAPISSKVGAAQRSEPLTL